MKKTFILILTMIISYSTTAQQKSIGQLVVADNAFYDLIDKDAKIEVLAEGFDWSEGPAWVKNGGYLLFSDVPRNTIYKWKEGEGITEFLKPSGYTGKMPYGDEPGSNGLIINQKGNLVACEHGDRRVSEMPLDIGGKRTLADNHAGKRFNSPNDVIQKSNSDYYFTDPPYGLPKKWDDTTRETGIFGVYRIAKNGLVTLLVRTMTRPNGLAFSPDEKTLYIAQSDPDKAVIMAFPVMPDGTVNKGKVLYDATSDVKKGLKGLPDGLRVDAKGNLFATGPGGVLVITPAGKLLGRIDTGEATANCSWGDDGTVLYITADMYLCRIKTKTKGAKY